ncbi:MAG: hypothetical protein VKJ06_08830 [Vampirovibrionales bacterium]|nr:hypothetical protein [Vampirovibrionales bacterium]
MSVIGRYFRSAYVLHYAILTGASQAHDISARKGIQLRLNEEQGKPVSYPTYPGAERPIEVITAEQRPIKIKANQLANKIYRNAIIRPLKIPTALFGFLSKYIK